MFDHEGFTKDLKVASDLEQELSGNPSRIGYYGQQAAHWDEEVSRLKAEKEAAAASVYISYKDGASKVTDGYINAQTQLNKDYKEADKELRTAREQLKLYEIAVSSLNSKQFSLGSLNSRFKVEHDATMGNTGTRITSEDRRTLKDRILDAQR